MRNIRKGTFETNSSSTHTLVMSEKEEKEYIPLGKHIKIEWIDTDDYYELDSLVEKLSYLVSHIANKLKYSCNNYEELLDEIEDNNEYQKIKEYIKNTFDKEIRFPDDKNGAYNDDVEDVVLINHQLIPWGSYTVAEDVLNELIQCMEDSCGERLENTTEDLTFNQKLDIYFKNGNNVYFGRD